MLEAVERRPLSFGWRTCQQVNGKSADQLLPAFWGGGEDRVYVLYQALQWTPPCVCSQVQRGQEQVSVLTMLSDNVANVLLLLFDEISQATSFTFAALLYHVAAFAVVRVRSHLT